MSAGQGAHDDPPADEERPTMTSTDSATAQSETWEPKPPELLPPWHTPEREKLQEQARRFAMDEVLPVANELDPQKGEIPASLLARIAELGYFGITVPEECGGLGLGVFEYCMVAEELARAWMSTASILARSQGLGTTVADDDRRRELLGRSARGEWIGAIALSEPDAGSDLAGVSTRAVLEGGGWVGDGRKRWCGNAKAADFIQVLVRVRDPEPDEPRSRGLKNLLLEKKRGEFPEGLTGHPIDKVGYHGFLTWDLTFDGVRIPADNVLDDANAGSDEEGRAGDGEDGRAGDGEDGRAGGGEGGGGARMGGRGTARMGGRGTARMGGRGTAEPPAPGSLPRRSSSTPRGCTPPRARSASPGRRSRIPSSTCRNGSSSATRSATSRPCGSPSPRWPRRSSSRGRSTGRSPTCSTSASRARRRRRW